MPTVSSLHGYKNHTNVSSLRFRLGLRIVQTHSQHILQTFEPTCQQQNTISQMRLFQVSVSASELPNLEAQSQSWLRVRPGYNFGSRLSVSPHVAGRALRGEWELTLMSIAILWQVLHVESLQQAVIDDG